MGTGILGGGPHQTDDHVLSEPKTPWFLEFGSNQIAPPLGKYLSPSFKARSVRCFPRKYPWLPTKIRYQHRDLWTKEVTNNHTLTEFHKWTLKIIRFQYKSSFSTSGSNSSKFYGFHRCCSFHRNLLFLFDLPVPIVPAILSKGPPTMPKNTFTASGDRILNLLEGKNAWQKGEISWREWRRGSMTLSL